METRCEGGRVPGRDGERRPLVLHRVGRCARRCRAGARRWPTWLTVVAAALLLAGGAGSARASSDGISGRSGKQGSTCATCHDDGVTPLVALDGPQRVVTEEVAIFRFVLQSRSSEQLFAGFNVASSDGVLGIVEGQGAQVKNFEVTHKEPKPVDSEGKAVWEFTWQAPTSPGPQTLYGAGVSANDSSSTAGDGSEEAMRLAVLVTQLGDANCDGRMSAADVSAEMTQARGGVSATCDLGDVDCNGTVQENDISTVIALVFDAAAPAACIE